MESQQREQTKIPARRESEPHHNSHQHTQPAYPEYKAPRRHTYEDGPTLTKVHSRPEDYKKYKNSLRTDKMFQYICFDGGHPQECDETNGSKTDSETVKREDKQNLDRYNSNISHGSSAFTRTDDSGNESGDELDDDSEDELTLPPTYQHDIGHRDNESCQWFNANRHTSSKKPDQSHASSEPNVKRHHADADLHSAAQHDLGWRDHAYQGYHHSPERRHHSRSPSPSSSSSLSRRHSPEPTQRETYLIAKVAKHLMAHREDFKHESAKQIANELLSEVVRKVADGTLDGKMMKEVVREVQHVL